VYKILIVEDSNLVRLKIIKTLEKHGFTNTVGINSGDLIIEKPYLYLKDVELIIMDIGLPGISGIEAAYWLKTNVHYAKTPVIFLSATSDSITVRNALKAGGVDYIVKPFEENDLIKRVQKIVGSPQTLSQDTIPTIDEEQAKKIISIEYSRSVRGKQPVSFIRLKVPKNDIKQSMAKLTDVLRQIDQVYVLKNEEILIILPLTDDNGSKIVEKKIENSLVKNKILIDKTLSLAVNHNKAQTLEELIQDILAS